MLSVITIKGAFDAKIIGTATDAAIKYEKEQYREKEILDDLDNTIKDALIAAKGNKAPVFIEEAHAIDVTRTSMNITATAIDEDKDADGNPEQLTYIFYFGTSEAELIEEARSTETPAVFPKTGLIDGMTYYFRIDVTDGKVTTTGIVGNTITITNNKPVFTNPPEGTAIANTNDQMIIEAMATDADEDDMLIYTLWWGTSEDNLEETTLTTEAEQGNTVSFTQMGLANDTRYYFKVVVSDGVCTDEESEGSNQRTWCKGEYCSGVSYSYQTCTRCDANHQMTCNICNGTVNYSCGGSFKTTSYKQDYSSFEYGDLCVVCKKNIGSGTVRYYTPVARCNSCGYSMNRKLRANLLFINMCISLYLERP